MQPLAPEPGGRRQPRQSPPPELRLPLPGSAALEAGAGTDGKGRPAHRPQVTRASERGGGGAQRPRRSDPPESRHVTGQTESPGPRRGPPLALAGPRPRRPPGPRSPLRAYLRGLGSSKDCALLGTRAGPSKGKRLGLGA